MSDYDENLRIHTIRVFWSPGTTPDFETKMEIQMAANSLMKELSRLGAHEVCVSDEFHIGLREEDT